MRINVTISSGMMGGTNVEVSQPTVDPPQFAGNYARLPGQIQKYLDKYIKDFPQVTPGTHTLEYQGRTSGDSGIATIPQ